MNKASLKWCAFVAIPITFLSLLPQLHLWYARGSQWQGAYATVDGDEFLYSAYINALIDGRPRRNDPFTGRDDNPKAPLPESTFSIQFIPPLVIAGFARVLGFSASSVFILLIGAAGFMASVSVFWFLLTVTCDNRIAAVGTLFVLCLGGMAAGQGLLGVLLKTDVSSVGFPFLRRYQPAAGFSLFFVFCTLVWRALVLENPRRARLYSAFAGLALGVLIFSYLYLWTAAAAWVVCCGLLWLYLRLAERRRTLEVLAILWGLALFALVPYLYLLTHRAGTLDETQTLISTHWPDVFRIPEIIGALVLVLLAGGVLRGKLKTNSQATILTASLALLPFILFNQQVMTGRSIQPFHFENFIANYAVLVSLVIAVTLFKRPLPSRAFLWIAVFCFLWGGMEVALPARARAGADFANDEMVPVLLRLKALSLQDGTFSDLRSKGKTPTLVFSPQIEVLRFLPTWTAQGVMVGLGGLDFGSATQKDQKVFTYLYFSGVNQTKFRDLLHDRTNNLFLNYYTRSAVFGHERALPNLSLHPSSIQDAEIEEQVRLYETYVTSFSREEALKRPITYVVVLRDSTFDFSRIDLWYERDAGELVGAYDLYRLRLRT